MVPVKPWDRGRPDTSVWTWWPDLSRQVPSFRPGLRLRESASRMREAASDVGHSLLASSSVAAITAAAESREKESS